jgi:hypothetical protein
MIHYTLSALLPQLTFSIEKVSEKNFKPLMPELVHSQEPKTDLSLVKQVCYYVIGKSSQAFKRRRSCSGSLAASSAVSLVISPL